MASPTSRPTDLITLRDAAALVGRSLDTLRDWRARYGLHDWRDTSTRSATSLVSRGDVLAIAARVGAATRLHVDVAPMVVDLRSERERLRRERDEAQAAREAAIVSRDAALLRIAELETLVAHGRRSALDDARARLLSR